MKLILLVCLVIVAVSCENAVKQVPPPVGPPIVISSVPPEPPTTPTPTPSPPVPTTSTTPRPTTPKPTTPTTKPPTTPTTKPPTTPTTKPPTTPTTKPPTPTTTQPPPPTTHAPPPGPVPEPSTGSWALNYTGTNRTCVMLDVAVQFEIIDGNATEKYNMPNTSLVSGECDNKTSQSLVLKWTDPTTKNLQSIEFAFGLNHSKFDLEQIHLALNFSRGQNDSKTYFLHHHKQEFVTPLHNSYKCAKVQTLNMTDDKNNTLAYLHISHVQLEAFTNVTGRTFSSAKDCAGSLTPDVVPIVVGCVLAALVVMVLVAYLYGRRRCQARGYLSM